jgi:hypothetical protein
MFQLRLQQRPTLITAAVGLTALLCMTGTALAVQMADAVKSYTGCLSTNGGTMNSIREGDTPMKPCPSGSTVAHFSGGDITEVTAQTGGGLTGGGTNGAVSLSLRRDCASGQVVKWDGTAWNCAADDNSTYTAGTGLDLSGSEFSVQEPYRLPQNGCGGGESVTRNTSIGGGAATWTCDQFALADQACPNGQFAMGVHAIGTLDCSAPPAPPGPEVKQRTTVLNMQFGGPDLEQVASMSLAEGNWVITTTVTGIGADAGDGGGHAQPECALRNGNSEIGRAENELEITDNANVQNTASTTLAFTAQTAMPAGGGTLSVWCHSPGTFRGYLIGRVGVIALHVGNLQ